MPCLLGSAAKALLVVLLLSQQVEVASAAADAQSLRGVGGGGPAPQQAAVGNSTTEQQAATGLPAEEVAAAGNLAGHGGEGRAPAALPKAPGAAANGTASTEPEASLFCGCGIRVGGFCCGKTWTECCRIGLFIRKCVQIKYDPRCTYGR